MNSKQCAVLVVGGGIIGLTSAFRLARAGNQVTVFDPAVAKGATWAAAGMLAPSGEIAPGEESNYALQKGAVAAWRLLAHELFEVTGDLMEIHETGTLLVGWDASDRRLIDQFIQTATLFDAPHRSVSRHGAANLFTGVSPRISEGFVLSGDAWIDPDTAVSLLSKALCRLGVLIVDEKVVSISTTRTGVEAHTESASFDGTVGILTTGSAPLPTGVAASGQNTVRPVRGVTVRVQGLDRSNLPTIRAYVRGHAFYMVSRPGGYCVLGATSDERSEKVVEVGELQRLLRDALDIVPELETAFMVENRIGLRPASANLRPFFEELGASKWAWSSGHYRHGVTLAPLAARQAVEFVEASA